MEDGEENDHSLFNYNTRKTIASGLFDVALVIANASQLKALVKAGPGYNFYYPNIVLICMSVLLQFIVAGFLVKLASMEAEKAPEERELLVRRNKGKMRLNNATVLLIVGIVFINAFIGLFGIEMTEEKV